MRILKILPSKIQNGRAHKYFLVLCDDVREIKMTIEDMSTKTGLTKMQIIQRAFKSKNGGWLDKDLLSTEPRSRGRTKEQREEKARLDAMEIQRKMKIYSVKEEQPKTEFIGSNNRPRINSGSYYEELQKSYQKSGQRCCYGMASNSQAFLINQSIQG